MTYRVEIPKDKTVDSSLALLKEGYRFIPNRRRKLQSDIFEVTLMGQRAICISGPEAAEVFYNEENFRRHGAAPMRIQKSLFGQKGVQTLDDDAHEKRKSLFMNLFTNDRMDELKRLTTNEWDAASIKWKYKDEITLFQETKKVMCRVACKWAAVPLREREVERRAEDLWSLVDAFGAVGPRHWQGRMARKRCERWVGNMIHKLRAGDIKASKGTAFYEMAFCKDINDELLDVRVAAVEVINILRPIVAISLYVLFGALALYSHPEEKEKLKAGGAEYTRIFTQEIRRYYPFTPFVGARARRNFSWGGYQFNKDTLVLLDVYGMNHDYRIWNNPSEFHPDRFKEDQLSKYEFIPQGGGEFIRNHRCAGELVTIIVMEKSFEFLTKNITYSVPKQNLHISATRMPPIVPSGFKVKNVEFLNEEIH